MKTAMCGQMHSIRTGGNLLRISRKLGNIASDTNLHLKMEVPKKGMVISQALWNYSGQNWKSALLNYTSFVSLHWNVLDHSTSRVNTYLQQGMFSAAKVNIAYFIH